LARTSFREAQLEGHAHGEQTTAAITAPDGDEEPMEFEMRAPIEGLESGDYRWIIFLLQASVGARFLPEMAASGA
jgi:hypothetical protein